MILAMRLFPAIPVAALLLASTAHADTRASAVVSAQGGYGSNPYFDSQDNDTGTIVLTAAPTVSLIGPTSTVNLNGRVEQVFFTSRYPDMTNWSLGADAAIKLSPRSNFKLAGSYSSAVNSGITQVSAVPPLDPNNPLPDPTTTEEGGRRTKTLAGNASFDSQFSLRDTVTLSGGALKVDYEAPNSSNYKSYFGTIGLMHVFNDTVSGGVSATYSKTDYDQAAAGSLKSFSPAFNLALKLSARTTLDLSAGATFSKDSGGTLPSSTQTNFSGSASLCHKGDRTNFCLSAARSVGATSLAGNSIITQVSANYNYALSPRSSIALAGYYSESNSLNSVAGFNTRYLGSSATYSHQLKERLSLTVTARYTDPIRSTIGNRRKSFYGGVGLSYRFGR